MRMWSDAYAYYCNTYHASLDIYQSLHSQVYDALIDVSDSGVTDRCQVYDALIDVKCMMCDMKWPWSHDTLIDVSDTGVIDRCEWEWSHW